MIDDFTKNNIFQIIGGNYKKIPMEIQNEWKNIFKNLEINHSIIDNPKAFKFLKHYFKKDYIKAFGLGDSKWKADLLRFCIMSKYSGIYSDVDQLPTSKLHNLPKNIDTITVIGAHSPPSKGIKPLPKGELHIGLIICKSPEPLFIDYISHMSPKVVASGKPYAINIQGLYAYLCKRWNINEIHPFKEYTDPLNNRRWYFLNEIKTLDGYKICDKNKDVVILSQHFSSDNFY
jgi:hypothetical protein